MKVLIIEQEKTIQQSLFYFLERFNKCEVSLARSIKDGISLFEENRFDVVLCGDRLPDGNGLDILKQLMKRNPNLVSILMTARGDEQLKKEVLDAGIRGYLEKPFDLKLLEEAVGIVSRD
jgi:DNA-binding response OmpR family regulator